MMEHDHLSPSQLTMLARCPQQWKRRYADGDIRPPGIAMLVGGGAHVGFEAGMNHKIEHHANLGAADVRDAAVNGFDERIGGEDVLLTTEEESRGKDTVVGESRDRVAALAHFWALVVQPEYQPAATEERWEIALPKIGTKLVGITDMVTADGSVVDWKTGRRRVSEREAHTSIQLTSYGLSFRKKHGANPASLCLDQLVEKAHETERNRRTTTRSDADYRCLLARCGVAMRMIRAGIFPPGLASEWWCSQRFCGYALTCPYYNPERDKET